MTAERLMRGSLMLGLLTGISWLLPATTEWTFLTCLGPSLISYGALLAFVKGEL